MMFFSINMDNEVPLVIPTDICCNCSSQHDIESIKTDIRYMPLFGLAGAEVKINIPFPYCPNCISSANKKRPGVLGFLAISTLVFAILIMGWLFYLSSLFSTPISEYVFIPIAAAISLALNIGFFFLRKKKTNQTSYYQPVKLKKVRGKWPNAIGFLSLAFTNPSYAKLFIESNQESITNKCLKVR